jgi:NADP-dependent 3-hydroxy acid dehydrogenase YdfG
MSLVTIPSPTHRESALTGQIVVVIGGSSGIGFETARHARAEGASVILTGRNADCLRHAVHTMANTALTGATYDIDGGQQLVSA